MQSSSDRDKEKFSLREQRRLAEAVRAACLQAALTAYEDACLDGLCHEGAWECAIDAVRSLDLDVIVRQAAPGAAD
jgi:hypothetical protein